MPRFVVNCCEASNDAFPIVEMEDVPEHCPICGAPVPQHAIQEEYKVTAEEAGV
jgi:rubrerythrin